MDYTIEYYIMGHLTKVVPNGARRIESIANSQVLNVAFQNTDGSLVLIADNDTTTPQAFEVAWHSQAFHYTPPVNTSVTFRWNAHDR